MLSAQPKTATKVIDPNSSVVFALPEKRMRDRELRNFVARNNAIRSSHFDLYCEQIDTLKFHTVLRAAQFLHAMGIVALIVFAIVTPLIDRQFIYVFADKHVTIAYFPIVVSLLISNATLRLGNALVWHEWYTRYISYSSSPTRWAAAIITLPTYGVLLALHASIRSVPVLTAIVGFSVISVAGGMLTELIQRPYGETIWKFPLTIARSTFLSSSALPFVAAWLVVSLELLDQTLSVNVPVIVCATCISCTMLGLQLSTTTLLTPRHYPYVDIAYTAGFFSLEVLTVYTIAYL